MNIKFAKLKKDAIIPSKRPEDAGLDVYSCFDDDFLIIQPHETKIIPTGLASVIEPGYFVKLVERSSTGTKGIAQRCGVIDSGYRGEWGVPITNVSNKTIYLVKDNNIANIINKVYGDDVIYYPVSKAICQAIVLPVPSVDISVIDKEELNGYKSERGTGGYGSSGK